MSNNFWSLTERGKWPRNPDGHVFLGRAVLQIGQAMFGDQWNDGDCDRRSEPRVHHHAMAPTGDDLMAVRGDAIWLRNKYMAGPPTPHSPLGQRPEPSKFSSHIRRASRQLNDEWPILKELSRKEASKIAAARKRFEAVQVAIAAAAEREELETSYRPTAGGIPQPCPAQWWATDQLTPRFSCCQIKPSVPFGYGISGDGYCHLFVTEASLTSYLATLTHRSHAVAPVDLASISPYLSYAVGLAIKWGYSAPDRVAKRAALPGLIKAQWEKDHPGEHLSNNVAEAMMTLLRFPNPEASEVGARGGRANKSG